jgi:hypothetical protein
MVENSTAPGTGEMDGRFHKMRSGRSVRLDRVCGLPLRLAPNFAPRRGAIVSGVRRTHRCAWITIAVLVALANAVAPAQGLLSRARDEVRDEPVHLPSPDSDDHGGGKSKGRRSHHHDCDDDDSLDELYGHLFLLGAYGVGAVITSPWWGPHVMVDEGLDIPNYFPGHPYYADGTGYMLTSCSNWADECPATSAMQLAFEYGHDLDQLQSLAARGLWEHQSRFGVSGEIRYLQEEGDFLDDELAIGDLNFVYRFAQSERVVLRSGVGINWLLDEHDADVGFNFTYGGDFFPVEPLVISSEIDWGTLGNAEVFGWRGTVGAAFDHVEIYAGYRYYELEGVALDGVILGLRTWF